MWNDRESAVGNDRESAVGCRLKPLTVGNDRESAVGSRLKLLTVGNDLAFVVCVPSVEKSFHQIRVVCYFLSPRRCC